MSRIVKAGNTIITYTTSTSTTSGSTSGYGTKNYRSVAHTNFDENVAAKLAGATGKMSLRFARPARAELSVTEIVEEIQRQVVKFKCRLIDIFQVCYAFLVSRTVFASLAGAELELSRSCTH